jgi:hypothetical protein
MQFNGCTPPPKKIYIEKKYFVFLNLLISEIDPRHVADFFLKTVGSITTNTRIFVKISATVQ